MQNDEQLKRIRQRFKQAMISDQKAVVRAIRFSPPEGLPDETARAILDRLEKSARHRNWRADHRPNPRGNTDLPIFEKREEIIQAIRRHPVIIVSGETGSGKSTQIPQYCLLAGRGVAGRIGCTQPRRIAATTIARRIAEEMGETVGASVGYKIRFQDRTRKRSFVKIMTDGILLMEAQKDPALSEYDTIIIDEAHERSLNIDFVLGILQGLVQKRRDLKLIITSATIDTEKFSRAFRGAPVIEVSGRMFPVDIRYALENDPESDEEIPYVDLAVAETEKLLRATEGDILVFMPTEQDIRETCEMLEGRKLRHAEILPLFARLSADDQVRVFSPGSRRRVVVATNVAETSITIPGIRYVIDTGLARVPRYLPQSRTTALSVTTVSRSSADQRMGRCGRVENGICIRLYSEKDYLSRPRFTQPEILRSNLAEVILRMIWLGLGDVERFPFIDHPPKTSIRDGFKLLHELGAVRHTAGGSGQKSPALTPRGKQMARMPLDPRLSRILIEAAATDCLKEATVLAAALSIQDPREKPIDRLEAARQAQSKFLHPQSDFLTLVNIWQSYHEKTGGRSTHGMQRRFCRDHYLSIRRMREWKDIHRQIDTILGEISLPPGSGEMPAGRGPFETVGDAALHVAILSGFLSNIARKKEGNIFQAAGGKEIMIFPGSALFGKAGEWIVAAEMVETSRLFARVTASIDPSWLEPIGGSLCRYHYTDAHWEKRRGEVVAREQVTLFGLPIVENRKISYGRIDPDRATEIFIRSALVDNDMQENLPFLEHNRKRIEEIESMEDRLRRRDILVSEEQRCQFYAKRLEHIYHVAGLKKRIRERGNDEFLRMRREDLLNEPPDEETLRRQFPETLRLGEQSFACRYRFAPGERDDGVTITIPAFETSQRLFQDTQWLVPGLLREKLTALLRGLPKTCRKRLVPINETVEKLLRDLSPEQGPLIPILSRWIHRNFGFHIPADAWPLAEIPDHLQVRFSVTDMQGREIRSGRDGSVLQPAGFDAMDANALMKLKKKWERNGITAWDMEALPERLAVASRQESAGYVYPGLQIVEGADGPLGLRLFQEEGAARASHVQAVAHLYSRLLTKDLRFLEKNLKLPQKLAPACAPFGGRPTVEKRIFEAVVKKLLEKNIRTIRQFEAHGKSIAPQLIQTGRYFLDAAEPILRAYHDAAAVLSHLAQESRANPFIQDFLQHREEDLARLAPNNFLQLYGPERWPHIPRYLRAVAIRSERAAGAPEKDAAKEKEIRLFDEKIQSLAHGLPPEASVEKREALEALYWLVEEFRVSIFAQELKTPVPVSKKRLDEKLLEIEQML